MSLKFSLRHFPTPDSAVSSQFSGIIFIISINLVTGRYLPLLPGRMRHTHGTICALAERSRPITEANLRRSLSHRDSRAFPIAFRGRRKDDEPSLMLPQHNPTQSHPPLSKVESLGLHPVLFIPAKRSQIAKPEAVRAHDR